MDKDFISQEIQFLEIGLKILEKNNSLRYEDLKPHQISILNQSFLAFSKYYPEKISAITDLSSFYNFLQNSSSTKVKIKKRIEELKKESGDNETKPQKETNAVPSELETMVALYKEHQADLLDTDNKKDSVAEIIKRARKSWNEKEKQRLIYQNAESERQKENNKFYSKFVDSKKGNRESILSNTYIVAKSALIAQGANNLSREKLNEAIDNLVYLAETGAIDIDNYKSLSVTSYLAVKKELKLQNDALDEIDNLVQKKQIAEETDPDSDDIDTLDTKINQLNQRADQQTDKGFVNRLSQANEDYELAIKMSKVEVEKVIKNLSEAIPYAKLPFQTTDILFQNKDSLEKALQNDAKANPNLGINRYAESVGSRTIGILGKTGDTRKLDSVTVNLYSHGLTPDKLKKLEESKNGSEFISFIKKKPGLEKAIRRRIVKINNTALGKKIEENLAKTKIPENFQRFSGAVKAVSDPIGTAKSFAYKRIGQSIGNTLVKNTNSVIAKKVGGYIARDGLELGLKTFASDATKKLATQAATWAATKLGVSLAAESANAIAPGLGVILDIGAQIALWFIEKTYIAARDGLRKYFNISEKDAKENRRAALAALGVGGAAIVGTMFTAGRGIKLFGTATKAAMFSALGIIWLSIATISFFLTLTFLTAPILSTIVQFDSVEKVTYSSGNDLPDTPLNCANMPWPFDGKWPITQGPRNTGCTHNGGISESVDFGMPVGTPVKSITSGVVSEAINSGTGYGNHVKVIATTDTGKTFTIIYGHFSSLKVSKGAKIGAGTVLGLSGNTGYSTGPHLHLGYIGIEYNSCPAGNHKIKENCCSTATCNQP